MGSPNALGILFSKQVRNPHDGEGERLIDLILKVDPKRGMIFFDCLCKPGWQDRALVFEMFPHDPDHIAALEYCNGEQTNMVPASWFYVYLMGAAIALGHYQFIRILLDSKKYDPNLPRDLIGTVGNILHLAILYGQPNAVFAILNSKLLDLNALDKTGKTALQLAVETGNEAAVLMLFTAGARFAGDSYSLLNLIDGSSSIFDLLPYLSIPSSQSELQEVLLKYLYKETDDARLLNYFDEYSDINTKFYKMLRVSALYGLDSIYALLLTGVDINGENANYIDTPLVATIEGKCYDKALLLWNLGAKPPKPFASYSFVEIIEKSSRIPNLVSYLESKIKVSVLPDNPHLLFNQAAKIMNSAANNNQASCRSRINK
jgi:hypothetical protein